MRLFYDVTSCVTLKMRWTRPYPAEWRAQVRRTVSATTLICFWHEHRGGLRLLCFVDENVDELEEELKSLLDESKPDSISGLPEVPAGPLRPPGGPSLPAVDLLGSLPAVLFTHLNITAEQLEEELNQLTLTDSGWCSQVSVSFTVGL